MCYQRETRRSHAQRDTSFPRSSTHVRCFLLLAIAGSRQASAAADSVLLPTRAPPRGDVQPQAGGVRPRKAAAGDAKRLMEDRILRFFFGFWVGCCAQETKFE